MMTSKLNLKFLCQRSPPVPPGLSTPKAAPEDFDPMRKRVVLLRDGAALKNARYVLYWMQIHRRAFQNQALNFAAYKEWVENCEKG